jgi:hypothetical protein
MNAMAVDAGRVADVPAQRAQIDQWTVVIGAAGGEGAEITVAGIGKADRLAEGAPMTVAIEG